MSIKIRADQKPMIQTTLKQDLVTAYVPKNVWIYIFSYLNQPSDFAKASVVCKKWRRIWLENVLWKNLFHKQFPHLIKTEKTLSKTDYLTAYAEAFRDQKIVKEGLLDECTIVKFRDPLICFCIDKHLLWLVTKHGKIQIFYPRANQILKTIPFKFNALIFEGEIFLSETHAFIKAKQKQKTELIIIDKETLELCHSIEIPDDRHILKVEKDNAYYAYSHLEKCIFFIELNKNNQEKVEMLFSHVKAKPHVSPGFFGLNGKIKQKPIIFSYHFDDRKIISRPEIEATWLQEDRNLYFTYMHLPDLVLYMHDKKTNERIKTLNLQHALHHCLNSKLMQAILTEDLLLILAAYDVWVDGLHIAFENKEWGKKSVVVINKKELKCIGTVEVPSWTDTIALNREGDLIIFGSKPAKSMEIIHLTKKWPQEKSSFCAIL